MPELASLFADFIDRPLAIDPSQILTPLAEISSAYRIAALSDADGAPPLFPHVSLRPDRGYDLVEGIAVIVVRGILIHKLGLPRPVDGVTGYDSIRAAFLAALADRQARAILLDIDSPGGDVAGLFDLCDTIYRGRGVKPIWAVLTEMACSSAYAIASAADRIIVPRTGITGSIGIIVMHVDLSQALEQLGIRVTIIKQGARKADGIEALPLSPAARARLQRDLDALGELFVETVARNRNLSADAIRDQEAATYRGAAGVSAGLADAIAAPNDAFNELLREIDPAPRGRRPSRQPKSQRRIR